MKALQKETHYMEDFSFDVHIFKEGNAYVAYVPALDLSSCGATDDEARSNIRDAVRGFLAASADMGTGMDSNSFDCIDLSRSPSET